MTTVKLSNGTEYTLYDSRESRATVSGSTRESVMLTIPREGNDINTVYDSFIPENTSKIEILENGSTVKIYTDYSIVSTFEIRQRSDEYTGEKKDFIYVNLARMTYLEKKLIALGV